MVVRHLKQIGKVKEFNSVPHELPENKKKSFWSVVFSFSMQQLWTVSQLDCGMWWKVDFIWQPAQWLDQEETSKHFPKPNLHQKKVMVTIWWFTACLIHHSFLNPSKTITSEKYAQVIDAAAAKLLQSCPTLCDPVNGSPSGSPVPGILQGRTLEWVAISFSNAWKWKVKVKSLSRVRLLATPWTAAHQAPSSMGFSRQEYWSGLPLPSPRNKSEVYIKIYLRF